MDTWLQVWEKVTVQVEAQNKLTAPGQCDANETVDKYASLTFRPLAAPRAPMYQELDQQTFSTSSLAEVISFRCFVSSSSC